MAGINFNSNSFQLRATSLKKANVAPEAQKKEEEVKAGSEEKKPVIKTKIQNSSLNLLGNYNMVSVNTTAKKATLSAGGKAGVVNNDNQGDKKVENDVNEKLDRSEFIRRHENGTLKPGDYYVAYLDNDIIQSYVCNIYDGNMSSLYHGFETPEEADEYAKKHGGKA